MQCILLIDKNKWLTLQFLKAFFVNKLLLSTVCISSLDLLSLCSFRMTHRSIFMTDVPISGMWSVIVELWTVFFSKIMVYHYTVLQSFWSFFPPWLPHDADCWTITSQLICLLEGFITWKHSYPNLTDVCTLKQCTFKCILDCKSTM